MTQRDKVLDTLREAGDTGVTNRRLNDVCFRYSARLQELRDSGFQIETVRLKQGLFLYRLTHEPHCASKEGTSGPPAERKPPGMAFARPLPEGTGGTRLFDLEPEQDEGSSAITGQPMRTSTGWVKRRSEAA